MKKYENSENYDCYRKTQIKRSESKWNSVTFNENMFIKTILSALPRMIVERTKKTLRPDEICCMGIRNGNEYTSLKKYQTSISAFNKSKIFGVDINKAVEKVGDNCFGYDFNKLPQKWSNKFDLVYSNSIDHSFDIKETLKEWHRVLKNDRFLLLHMSTSEKVCSTDIYSFNELDCNGLFDRRMFDVEFIWKEYGQEEFFNILMRIKK